MYQIDKYVDVNILGTARFLDLLVNEDHEIKKVVVASSMSVMVRAHISANTVV